MQVAATTACPSIRRVIFLDVPPDDMILAMRAVKWLISQSASKDAIIAYGEGKFKLAFYVKRNKSSITVRPCTSGG